MILNRRYFLLVRTQPSTMKPCRTALLIQSSPVSSLSFSSLLSFLSKFILLKVNVTRFIIHRPLIAIGKSKKLIMSQQRKITPEAFYFCVWINITVCGWMHLQFKTWVEIQGKLHWITQFLLPGHLNRLYFYYYYWY